MRTLIHFGYCIAVFLLAYALVLPVQAQSEVPPDVTLTPSKTSYLVGEPVLVEVEATNTTDEPQNYGPINLWNGHFKIDVEGPLGEVAMFDAFQGTGAPWLNSELTVTPPGGVSAETLLLSPYYDVLRPGTYALTVGYPTVSRVPVPTDVEGTYRLSVTGYNTETVTFDVVEPADPSARADAEDLAAALRKQMGSRWDESIDSTYQRILSTGAAPYLQTAAEFYRLYYREQQGGTVEIENAAWQDETSTLAMDFIDRLSEPVYLALAAQILSAARYRSSPPPSVGVNPWKVGVGAECGGDVYGVANANEEPVTVQVQPESSPEVTLELPPMSTSYIRAGSEGDHVSLYHEGQLLAIVVANASTCSEALLELVIGDPDFEDLPAAIAVAASDGSGTFNGNPLLVSGIDHTLAGELVPDADSVHAILATTSTVQQALLGALPASEYPNIVGRGGEGDIAEGQIEFDPSTWVDAILEQVTVTLPRRPSASLVGTAEAPVVAHAPDGLDLSGNIEGHGVLLVDGDLSESGGVRWTGLVIVRGTATAAPDLSIQGSAGIVGGVLLLAEDGQTASLRLSGRSEVRFSRAALDFAEQAAFDQE